MEYLFAVPAVFLVIKGMLVTKERIVKRLICRFVGHRPAPCEMTEIVIPYREILCPPGVTVRCMGRRFKVGDTNCARCGVGLRLDDDYVTERN